MSKLLVITLVVVEFMLMLHTITTTLFLIVEWLIGVLVTVTSVSNETVVIVHICFFSVDILLFFCHVQGHML